MSELRGVVAFTGAYLAAAAVAAVVTGNLEFVFYILILLLLIGFVWIVHRSVGLSRGVLWALSVWGLLHMAGGLVAAPGGWPIAGDKRVLYSLWLVPGLLKFDHLVHAYGFGVTTWACWQGLRSALATRGAVARPTFGLLTLAVAAGLGFGALNEVVEFAAVLLVPDTNVGGYINTGWDLVANLVGAVTAAALIRRFGGTPAAGAAGWKVPAPGGPGSGGGAAGRPAASGTGGAG